MLFTDDEGKTWLLDGRNRQRAAVAAGVDRPHVTWNGEGGTPLGYVHSRNTHRRHLSPSQLAAIAAEALPMFEAEAKDRQRLAAERTNAARSGEPGNATLDAPENSGEAREQAAKAVGASPRYVSDAEAIREAAPDVHEEVKAGTVTVPEGKRIAELPAEERKTALDEARANKAKGKKRANKKAAAPILKPTAEALTDVQDGMTALSKALYATPTSSSGEWWAPLREALLVAKRTLA